MELRPPVGRQGLQTSDRACSPVAAPNMLSLRAKRLLLCTNRSRGRSHCRAVQAIERVRASSSTAEPSTAEPDLHTGEALDAQPSTSRPAGDRKQTAELSAAQIARNTELISRLRGKLILAPLTRGGNVPFRRLCADFGAEATMSEMSFARFLLKGDPLEKARLRKADNEHCFGFQIATNNIGEGIGAGKLAAEAGASWLDLNCGCPIYEATKRGMGSALLRKPPKLARLVAGIAEGIDIPLTVKIRTGTSYSTINAEETVTLLSEAGAAAVTVHGRTAEQRYKKPADWELLSGLAEKHTVPLIGNGDILTYYEARERMQDSSFLALMAGRGALIKPWIFQEVREGRELALSAQDRVGVYRQLVSHMKDHFGDDAKGWRKASYFLPWHFDFFCRYRHFPEDKFGETTRQQPLMGRRNDLAVAELGETLESLPVLERLLRCESTSAHKEIAHTLWDSHSDSQAITYLKFLAADKLLEWEETAVAKEDSRAQG